MKESKCEIMNKTTSANLGMTNKRLRLSLKNRIHKDATKNFQANYPDVGEYKHTSTVNGSQKSRETQHDTIKCKTTTPEIHEITKQNNVASLRNMGNTCYLNSLIYALRCLKEFREQLHLISNQVKVQKEATEKNICLELHELFQDMHVVESDTQVETVPSSLKLLNQFRKFNAVYEGNCQHDVHELLECLLNCIEWCQNNGMDFKVNRIEHSGRKALRNMRKRLSDYQSSLFHGDMLLKTVCLECENVSETRDQFWDISVSLQSSIITTGRHRTLFDSLQSREMLRDDNKFLCYNCNHRNEAYRSMHITRLPQILVVRAKQIMTTVGEGMYKTDGEINVPLEIPCLLETCSKPCSSTMHTYHLKSFICHVGASYSTGHYTTYIHVSTWIEYKRKIQETRQSLPRKAKLAVSGHKLNGLTSNECCGLSFAKYTENSWLHFDDDKVTVLHSLPVFNTEHSTTVPYLLFYSRNYQNN